MVTSKADKYFSLYIRLRDADENGNCHCCTCGKIQLPKEADCGHFIKRQHQRTRFNEMNAAAQCGKCNRFEQGRDTDFERYLINKYGADKIMWMKLDSHKSGKRNQFELDQIAKYYKLEAEKLAKEKGLKLW
jgi:hypothetical protein